MGSSGITWFVHAVLCLAGCDIFFFAGAMVMKPAKKEMARQIIE